MAKIILASWMVRYPLGGNLSWGLQQLLGYKELGHEIYLVEKYGYYNSCFNPVKKDISNDCSYGVKIVSDLLEKYGLKDKWCFVEYGEVYHGLSKKQVNDLFRTADLFIDTAPDGSWAEEASNVPIRVFIDGEPGFCQMNAANRMETGHPFDFPNYSYYYTNGRNIGRPGNPVPTWGTKWGHIYSPVSTKIFADTNKNDNRAYTTIMNWQSHKPLEYKGKIFGQKDIEFIKFISLPNKVKPAIEVAVSGAAPRELLAQNKWLIQNAQEVTITFDVFCNYIATSRGEFSVCKNVFVDNNTGWFSDKSAVYLANKKPVVVQDTGFSDHLPIGEGLFAVKNVDEAVAAIEKIESNYEKHSKAAYEIARENLEASKVCRKFLDEIGF